MKITLSKSQWEFLGKKAGWMKKADNMAYMAPEKAKQVLEQNNPSDKARMSYVAPEEAQKMIDQQKKPISLFEASLKVPEADTLLDMAVKEGYLSPEMRRHEGLKEIAMGEVFKAKGAVARGEDIDVKKMIEDIIAKTEAKYGKSSFKNKGRLYNTLKKILWQ